MARLVLPYLALIFVFNYLHCAFSVSDAEFQAVIRRLEILENKDRTNHVIIDELQEHVHTQSTTIKHLHQELKANYDTITSLTNTVSTLSGHVLALSNRVSILEEGKQSHNSEHENKSASSQPNGINTSNGSEKIFRPGAGYIGKHPPVERSVQRHTEAAAKRFLIDTEIPIAFHANMVDHDVNNISKHQNIVFDNVLLNLGSAYHSQHGLFIAPAPGLYLFSTTIMSYFDPASAFQADIVKNGAILGRVFTHGDSRREDQSAMTVIVQLAANDEVWIRQNQGTRMFGSFHSSFTGLLLMPL